MYRLLAFDVDNTLDIADGPVPLEAVRTLSKRHIIALCGNWPQVFQGKFQVQGIFTFVGPIDGHYLVRGLTDPEITQAKANFLRYLRVVPAFDYVMVGDRVDIDGQAAKVAGFRYIESKDFKLKDLWNAEFRP